jgi:glutamate carboxypeptidase
MTSLPSPSRLRTPRHRAGRLLVAVALVLGAGGALAAPDAALVVAAEREVPAVIDSLEKMVAIETGSADVQALNTLATMLDGRLAAMGFKTERRKATAGPGADIVVGTLQGSGRQKVMLVAHMDTVYDKGILASQPYKRDGNKLYGPGIADDKGGIAVILHGLKILLDAGWRDFARITVVFNPDEEIGSIGSGELLASLAAEHDTALGFEPNGAKAVVKQESLLLGAAGTAQATLEVKGRAAHAGAAPQEGRNAIIELSHQLLQTRDVAKDIPGAQLNWTNTRSLKATNQIPDLAVATADVRLTEPGAETKLLEALKAKVAASRLVPDTESTVSLRVGRPAYKADARGRALAERAQAIYRELDKPLALVPMTGGATDAAFLSRPGKAAVLESFGLAGWGFHARDEYIEIDSIVPRLYLLTRLLTELGR